MQMTDYKEIRSRIETGDLFFTASPALFSKIIRFFTRSKVSHVGIFIIMGERVFTTECLEGKNCILSLASVRLENEPLILMKTYRTDQQEIINSVLQDINKVEYDMYGALLALFYNTKTRKRFCSEWVANILNLDFSFLTRGIVPYDLLTYFINKN